MVILNNHDSVRKSIYKTCIIWSPKRLTLADRCLQVHSFANAAHTVSASIHTRRSRQQRGPRDAICCHNGAVPVAGPQLLIAGNRESRVSLPRLAGRLPVRHFGARLIVNTMPCAAMRSGARSMMRAARQFHFGERAETLIL